MVNIVRIRTLPLKDEKLETKPAIQSIIYFLPARKTYVVVKDRNGSKPTPKVPARVHTNKTTSSNETLQAS